MDPVHFSSRQSLYVRVQTSVDLLTATGLVHLFITTLKRSLGQDNIFTSICHSVHGGGGGASQHASQVT